MWGPVFLSLELEYAEQIIETHDLFILGLLVLSERPRGTLGGELGHPTSHSPPPRWLPLICPRSAFPSQYSLHTIPQSSPRRLYSLRGSDKLAGAIVWLHSLLMVLVVQINRV